MAYNFQLFNIYGQLKSELADFFDTKTIINGTKYDKNKGYKYNQCETLQLVEFVGASKFQKEKDSEGQDKMYLNSSVFRADVASKQIDIDVKNIVFIPDDFSSDVACVINRRKFKRFAKDTALGVDLNDMVEKYPFYGSLVVKKRGKEFDIIDLNKLRNQQDAKDLNTASYVVIEHNMKAWEAQAMPNWDLKGLEYNWDEDFTVYERYGRVPMRFFDATADENKSVDTVSFIVLDKKGKKEVSQLLFIEQIDERPFREVHWKRRNGRWLGIGEIENNFENQKARNAIFNMRMRSALWSSKNIFQYAGDDVAKNLVSEVRDGDVLSIGQGTGGVSQVNTQTKGLADYNSIDDTVEKNSDQKSFTYEVATGESMPSGTPFRLGVVLSNAVDSHFGLKREKLALFIKEIIYDFIFPDFARSVSKRSLEAIFTGQDGYDELIEAVLQTKTNDFIKKVVFSEFRLPTPEELEIFQNLVKSAKGFEIDVIKAELENAKYSIDIEIDGESVDINKRLETLTNLYTAYAQSGDPRADTILARIGKLTGERLPKSVASPSPVASPVAIETNEPATV